MIKFAQRNLRMKSNVCAVSSLSASMWKVPSWLVYINSKMNVHTGKCNTTPYARTLINVQLGSLHGRDDTILDTLAVRQIDVPLEHLGELVLGKVRLA